MDTVASKNVPTRADEIDVASATLGADSPRHLPIKALVDPVSTDESDESDESAMTTWHYLPVYVENSPRPEYGLCEVYLDAEGRLITWTAEPSISAGGESLSELAEDLTHMLSDAIRWQPVAFHRLAPGMTFTRAADGPRS